MIILALDAEIPSTTLIPLAGLLAIGLALVHIFAYRLRFLDITPRSRWLSFGSGVSVAYVFVHILPDLSHFQTTLPDSVPERLAFLEHHVYLMALLGLAMFYGLERVAKISRQRSQEAGNGDVTEAKVFWLHIVSFGLYNLLIGYLLLHREEPGYASLLLFSFAMALHFVVNDYGLHQHHKKAYVKIGRWILAATVIAGWAIGSHSEVPHAVIALLFSFLAGGIVLNVLKEELPEERDSRFWTFAFGATGYAALLLFI
ncbi:hypothetical protein NDI45_01255 [Leptolyngbya sp. GB1-A1]